MPTKTAALKTANLWFDSVKDGGRKSCPNCKAKLPPGEAIWNWGEYLRGKWHGITRFCVRCFARDVFRDAVIALRRLQRIPSPQGRNVRLPGWLTQPFEGECEPFWTGTITDSLTPLVFADFLEERGRADLSDALRHIHYG